MTLMHSRGPAALSLTCLPYHLDEHFSGLRRILYFSQEGAARSAHAIPGFQADVKAEAIDRSHLRLLRFNTNKPFGEQDERILMVGIHLDEPATSWDGLKKTGSKYSAISPCRIPRLLDWPRTGDQDVHKSLGAFLPVGPGRYVGDANQRAK